MRFFWLMSIVLPVYAQMCVPARMLPADAVAGALDGASCQLSDGSAYAQYRLDLPMRGKIHIGLTTAQDFLLILRDNSGAKLDSGATIDRPIEAGAYTVLVNARTAGQSGGYSVETAFTAEPGTLCSAFPQLGVSQTAAGRLGASGCALPDGTPYEAYFLNTLGAGTLTVTATSDDFTPAVTIRTPDGSAAASGDGNAAASVDGDTRYQVVIATGDKTGAFQIATSFEPARDETCRAVKTFAESGSAAGAISGESCTATLAGSGDLQYFDYYFLKVDAAGAADIRVASGDFAPTLWLLDEGGNTLATDFGGGANGGAEIRMQLSPGTYTIEIFSSVLSGGAYQVDYQLVPGAPQPCLPAPASAGDGQSAQLSQANCRTGLGLAQIYAMTLPAAGTLDLTLTADTSLAGAVAIRDLKDNLIVMTGDVQGLGITRLSADLPAGAYTVLTAASSGSGAYQLTSKLTAHDIPPCSFAQALDINGGYIKILSPFSCRGANGGPMDLYEFTLPADATVAAIMTSSEVDGYLTLLDSAGNVLRTDDNSYGFGDPLIVQYLPAGTYRLAARAASGTTGGLYEVDVRTILGPRPGFCGTKATIPMGGSTSGTIDFSGCQYRGVAFADIYRIDVTSSGAVDIRMNSGAFDTYLVLVDDKGNVVEQDDDSGGGSNARINRLLAPGTYYVVATAATDYTAGGAYTVSVAAGQ